MLVMWIIRTHETCELMWIDELQETFLVRKLLTLNQCSVRFNHVIVNSTRTFACSSVMLSVVFFLSKSDKNSPIIINFR